MLAAVTVKKDLGGSCASGTGFSDSYFHYRFFCNVQNSSGFSSEMVSHNTCAAGGFPRLCQVVKFWNIKNAYLMIVYFGNNFGYENWLKKNLIEWNSRKKIKIFFCQFINLCFFKKKEGNNKV